MKIMSDAEYFGIKLVAALFVVAVVVMLFWPPKRSERSVIQVGEPYIETEIDHDTKRDTVWLTKHDTVWLTKTVYVENNQPNPQAEAQDTAQPADVI